MPSIRRSEPSAHMLVSVVAFGTNQLKLNVHLGPAIGRITIIGGALLPAPRFSSSPLEDSASLPSRCCIAACAALIASTAFPISAPTSLAKGLCSAWRRSCLSGVPKLSRRPRLQVPSPSSASDRPLPEAARFPPAQPARPLRMSPAQRAAAAAAREAANAEQREQELQAARAKFTELDVDGSGSLDRSELAELAKFTLLSFSKSGGVVLTDEVIGTIR